MTIQKKTKRESEKNRHLKELLLIFGIFVALSSATIPLSSVGAKDAYDRGRISIGVGIAKMVAIEVVGNQAGADVEYSNGVYSKVMANGESISNFGTTTMRIICNFDTNSDSSYQNGYNCKDNGWALSSVAGDTVQKSGTSYAAMVANSGRDSILSETDSLTSSSSNWAFKVSPVARSISGVDVSPTIVTAYASPHTIPATSTEIANGKSWKTISNKSTYIDGFNVSVQYGVTVGGAQAAGVYTGAVNYTASLKASS